MPETQLDIFLLQEKRLELCKKIEEERYLCVNLRVQIRLEQERIQKRRSARINTLGSERI